MAIKNEQLCVDLKLQGTLEWTGAYDVDLAVTERGDLDSIDDLANVRQALFKRLNCPKGDLWAHPEYGNAVWDILSECMDDDFKMRAVDALRECMQQEPRVRLLDIQVEEQPESRLFLFTLTYEVLNDTRTDNLVWSIAIDQVQGSV